MNISKLKELKAVIMGIQDAIAANDGREIYAAPYMKLDKLQELKAVILGIQDAIAADNGRELYAAPYVKQLDRCIKLVNENEKEMRVREKLRSLYELEKEIIAKLPNNKDDWDLKNNPEHSHYFGMVQGLMHGSSIIETFMGEHAFPKAGEAEKHFREQLKLTEELFAEKDE